MKKILTINKKGQFQDFVDTAIYLSSAVIFFVIILGALLLIFENNESESIANVGEFRQKEAAINNLRVSLWEGTNLHKQDLDKQVLKSKVLGGKVITSCFDYQNGVDCPQDSVNTLSGLPEYSCEWNEEKSKCFLIYNGAVGGMK